MKQESKLETMSPERVRYMVDMLKNAKEEYGDRLQETRKLFGPVTLLDPHTHSDCSDGHGSVSQNYEAAMTCGLDWVFVTDHYSLEAKKYARMLEGISWGQEPVMPDEHVVTLNNDELIGDKLPKKSTLFAEAVRHGRFAFIPHPAGQGEVRGPTAERAAQLMQFAGREFAMELLNGLFKFSRAWDPCCEAAVGLWEHLLAQGCRITPLGGSDAHDPFSIGTAWTGIPEACADLKTLFSALEDGKCFASEAAMLDFRCHNRAMGSVLATGIGKELVFHCRAVDSGGLQQVGVRSEAGNVKTWQLAGETQFEDEWRIERAADMRYFRLEATSGDGRRAFSSPIYLPPSRK